MNKNNINDYAKPSGYLYLDIISEKLDIDDLSSKLAVMPTSVILNTKAGCDHWEYGFNEQELYDFQEMQNGLIHAFRGKEKILKAISVEYNANIVLQFVAYNVIDYLIGIDFDQNFIAFAHDIGASIDIDSYFKMRANGEAETMSAEQDLILIKKL